MNDYPAIIVNSGPTFHNRGFRQLSPIMKLAATFTATVMHRTSNNSENYNSDYISQHYGGKT
jgi:hypothetical protein